MVGGTRQLVGHSSGKGSITMNSMWSLATQCATGLSRFFSLNEHHPPSKSRVLRKEQKCVQTIKTAIMYRKRDAKIRLLKLRFLRLCIY